MIKVLIVTPHCTLRLQVMFQTSHLSVPRTWTRQCERTLSYSTLWAIAGDAFTTQRRVTSTHALTHSLGLQFCKIEFMWEFCITHTMHFWSVWIGLDWNWENFVWRNHFGNDSWKCISTGGSLRIGKPFTDNLWGQLPRMNLIWLARSPSIMIHAGAHVSDQVDKNNDSVSGRIWFIVSISSNTDFI